MLFSTAEGSQLLGVLLCAVDAMVCDTCHFVLTRKKLIGLFEPEPCSTRRSHGLCRSATSCPPPPKCHQYWWPSTRNEPSFIPQRNLVSYKIRTALRLPLLANPNLCLSLLFLSLTLSLTLFTSFSPPRFFA